MAEHDHIPWDPWDKTPQRIADLGRWLKEQGRGPDDWPYFIERASKWQPEYDEMCREEEQDRILDEQDALDERHAL
jgi:hypothetical protein